MRKTLVIVSFKNRIHVYLNAFKYNCQFSLQKNERKKIITDKTFINIYVTNVCEDNKNIKNS